jgi:hypothetical protein
LCSNSFICRDNWLLSSIIDLNNLVRSILWPEIPLFVMEKVINKQHMSEINEAVTFSCLVMLLFVHRNFQVIESILVISIEVSSDFLLCVSTWDVSNHQIGSYLLTS